MVKLEAVIGEQVLMQKMDIPSPNEVTEDTLLAGKIRFFQPRSGYRAAIDPILLAAIMPVAPHDHILDIGCGAGAASLCLGWREKQCRIVGLELNPDLVQLAKRNIDANQMDDRLSAIEGDLAHLPPSLAASSFDGIMTNPPFAPERQGTPPPDPGKKLAHIEGALSLREWIRASVKRLKPKGWFAIIHRAERMDEAIAAMSEQKLGGLVVFPLWPKADRPAKRVLLLGRKGVKTPALLTPGLILHNDDGGYSPAAERLLRDGDAIFIPGQA